MSTLVADNELRNLVCIKFCAENARSLGTELAGVDQILIAKDLNKWHSESLETIFQNSLGVLASSQHHLLGLKAPIINISF